MSFYLEPPRGTISLQNLEKFAVKRLDFLIQILQARNDRVKMFDIVHDAVNVSDSECLIDGSKKDAISHFILRLALCGDIDTVDFLVAAETSLFEFRFLCMNEDELTELFRKTNKQIDKNSHQTCNSCIVTLVTTFRMLKEKAKRWKRVVQLYLKGDNSIYFQVPFCYVFNLVAKRQVVLSNGIAAVPFPKLREVVSECFKNILKEGIIIAREKRQVAELDVRMKRLMRKLVTSLRSKHRLYPGNFELVRNLSHDSVSMETSNFPPCMYNLYTSLQQKHRLRHHSRIQFTLFLKEIGMPVHEALMYWRKEYSIPVNNQDGCFHDWKDNEKRYVYNIRHLYGLEGSHINYRAHSCTTLQNFSPVAGEVGGCPFKHFDRQHLNVLLDNLQLDDHVKKNIYKLVNDQEYSKACCQVLNDKLNLSSKSNKANTSQENMDCDSEESSEENKHTDKLWKESDLRDNNGLINICNTGTTISVQDDCNDCFRELHHGTDMSVNNSNECFRELHHETHISANNMSVDLVTSNENNMTACALPTNVTCLCLSTNENYVPNVLQKNTSSLLKETETIINEKYSSIKSETNDEHSAVNFKGSSCNESVASCVNHDNYNITLLTDSGFNGKDTTVTNGIDIGCEKDQHFTDCKISKSNIEIKEFETQTNCVIKLDIDDEYCDKTDMKSMVQNDILGKDNVITKPSDFYFKLKLKTAI